MSTFHEFAQDPFAKELFELCKIADVPAFINKVTQFFEELTEVNKTLNLTRITSAEDFWHKHILDALMIIHEVPELADPEAKVKVADIGSGGGVPLLPLALAFPHASFIGFESRRKKTFYLLEEIESLELVNCAAFPFRAIEASHQEDFKEMFDIVTARAVARLEKLIPEARRFLKPKARMVFYKTPTQLEEEIESAKAAAQKNKTVLELSEIRSLPCEAGERQFAIVKPKQRRRNR